MNRCLEVPEQDLLLALADLMVKCHRAIRCNLIAISCHQLLQCLDGLSCIHNKMHIEDDRSNQKNCQNKSHCKHCFFSFAHIPTSFQPACRTLALYKIINPLVVSVNGQNDSFVRLLKIREIFSLPIIRVSKHKNKAYTLFRYTPFRCTNGDVLTMY